MSIEYELEPEDEDEQMDAEEEEVVIAGKLLRQDFWFIWFAWQRGLESKRVLVDRAEIKWWWSEDPMAETVDEEQTVVPPTDFINLGLGIRIGWIVSNQASMISFSP